MKAQAYNRISNIIFKDSAIQGQKAHEKKSDVRATVNLLQQPYTEGVSSATGCSESLSDERANLQGQT